MAKDCNHSSFVALLIKMKEKQYGSHLHGIAFLNEQEQERASDREKERERERERERDLAGEVQNSSESVYVERASRRRYRKAPRVLAWRELAEKGP